MLFCISCKICSDCKVPAVVTTAATDSAEPEGYYHKIILISNTKFHSLSKKLKCTKHDEAWGSRHHVHTLPASSRSFKTWCQQFSVLRTSFSCRRGLPFPPPVGGFSFPEKKEVVYVGGYVTRARQAFLMHGGYFWHIQKKKFPRVDWHLGKHQKKDATRRNVKVWWWWCWGPWKCTRKNQEGQASPPNQQERTKCSSGSPWKTDAKKGANLEPAKSW